MTEPINENVSVQEGAGKQKVTLGKKFILMIVILLVLMLAVNVFRGALNKSKSEDAVVKKTQIQDAPTTDDLVQDPLADVDALIQEEIDAKYQNDVEATAGHEKATTKQALPSTTLDDMNARLTEMGLTVYTPPEPEPEPDVVVEPTSKPNSNQNKSKDINPYTASFKSLYAKWDAPIGPSRSVNLSIPQDIRERIQEGDSQQQEADKVNSELSGRGVKFLRVYPATLELGYNSDTGGLMVVSVHLPGLRNVKFEAQTQVGAYNERAAINLTRGVTDDGDVFNVSGVIVDQNDRIPSVKGKVNRHILYNTIYGFGTTFLDAFAAYKSIDSGVGLNLPFVNPNGGNTVDTDGVIVGNAASSVSRSVKQLGEFRPNTLTTKAFSTVGVVFLPEGG